MPVRLTNSNQCAMEWLCLLQSNGKRQRHSTYTAPLVATAAAAALYVTDRVGVQPTGRRLRLHRRLWPTTNSHTQPWITTHLLTPKGWKA